MKEGLQMSYLYSQIFLSLGPLVLCSGLAGSVFRSDFESWAGPDSEFSGWWPLRFSCIFPVLFVWGRWRFTVI